MTRLLHSLLILISTNFFPSCTSSSHVSFLVENTTPNLITLYWISPSGAYVIQGESDIAPMGSLTINSYEGHGFAAVSLRMGCWVEGGEGGKGIRAGGKENIMKRRDVVEAVRGGGGGGRVPCNETRFVVGEGGGGDLLYRIRETDKGVESYLLDEGGEAFDYLWGECGGERGCVKRRVGEEREAMKGEVARVTSVRDGMSEALNDYVCRDRNLKSSDPVRSKNWEYVREVDGVSEGLRDVDVMFESEAVKVHVIRGFLSKEECQAVEDVTEGTLMKATVADGKGGSMYSEARKALQARVEVPWGDEEDGDLISRLSRRAYEYTNLNTNYDLKVEGQEDLMLIQYDGRGVDSGVPPDRYSPHCDSECGGGRHKVGQRVATIVMYCEVPDYGGATTFTKSNVRIVGEAGDAVWFTYAKISYPEGGGTGDVGDYSGVQDNGYSEHSGCPVYAGRKRIVTQWMRKGVGDGVEWTDYDTNNVRRDVMDGLFVGEGEEIREGEIEEEEIQEGGSMTDEL